MKKRLNIVVMITLLFCFSIGSVSIPSAEGAYTNLSEPVYQVTVDYGVMILMRDGVHLASNIWRPNAEGNFRLSCSTPRILRVVLQYLRFLPREAML